MAAPYQDLCELIPVAAGERIVAFARPGKPSGASFWWLVERVPR